MSLFGARYQVVLRAQNNYTTMPSRWKLHHELSSSLNAIRDRLPKICVFPFRRLAARIHNIATTMMRGHANLHSALPPRNHIKSFHKEHPEWVPVRLDKNTHCFALVCYTFFCQLVVKRQNAGNYRMFHTFPSPTHLYTTYLMYFYTLVLCGPVLKRHVRSTYMRARLSQMSKPLKDYRFSTYQGTPPPIVRSSPVTRGRMRAQFPLPHGPSSDEKEDWDAFRQSVFTHAAADIPCYQPLPLPA